MTKPKIIIFDIETSPNLAAIWRPGKQYVSHQSIVQERVILCGAWKYLHGRVVYHTPTVKFTKSGVLDDREVVNSLIEGLSDADMLVSHNGDRFDIPWINGRAFIHRVPPLMPILNVDTYKVARRRLGLNSSSLAYLAQVLGLNPKTSTNFELWLRCLRNDKKALREMLAYNIDDVELLEQVYLEMLPFINNHPNIGVIIGKEDTCPNCGTKGKLQKRGFLPTRVGRKQRYQCTACGSWHTGAPQRVKEVEVR